MTTNDEYETFQELFQASGFSLKEEPSLSTQDLLTSIIENPDAPAGFYIPWDIYMLSFLSEGAKFLFGMLTALAHAKGYAFPSNAYLADVMNVSERHIRRRILELKECGLLKIATHRKGRKELRQIFLYPFKREDQKNIRVDTTVPQTQSRVDKNVRPPGQICPSETPSTYIYLSDKFINNKRVNERVDTLAPDGGSLTGGGEKSGKPTKREEASQVREFVRLTAKQQSSLKDKHGEEGFNALVEKLNAYKQETGKSYKSDYLAIKRWVIEAYDNERKIESLHKQRKKKHSEGAARLARILETNKERGDLRLEENGVTDYVYNKTCSYANPRFMEIVTGWYGYEHTED